MSTLCVTHIYMCDTYIHVWHIYTCVTHIFDVFHTSNEDFSAQKRSRVLCATSHELCTWVTNCMNMRHKLNWYESQGCAVWGRACVCCASSAVYIVRDLCVTNYLYVEQGVLHVQCDMYSSWLLSHEWSIRGGGWMCCVSSAVYIAHGCWITNYL